MSKDPIFYEYITEGEYQGTKRYKERYISTNGRVMYTYSPEGVKYDDLAGMRSFDYDSLSDDKYFKKILNDKGPAAQVAWSLTFANSPAGKRKEVRKSHLLRNSWYVSRAQFMICHGKTRHIGMIRISNHEPDRQKWTMTAGEYVWCVNIIIGKDRTLGSIDVFPRTITFRYDNAAAFYSDRDMYGMVRDLVENGNLTSLYGKDGYIFMRKPESKEKNAAVGVNMLNMGFTRKDLTSLPHFRENDPEMLRYNRGMYTTPDGTEVKLYWTKNYSRAFYFDPPHMKRDANRKYVRIIDGSLSEAVQCLPVPSADTGKMTLGNMYSEERLFAMGMQSFYDIIHQLDVEKFNRFLQTVELKFGHKFTYSLTKYYTDIVSFIDKEDIDGILRKAIVRIGRKVMDSLLNKLDFSPEGKLTVYKKFTIADFMNHEYYANWCEWNSESFECGDDDIVAEAEADIEDVDFETTAIYAMRCPELNSVFMTEIPRIKTYTTVNGERALEEN